MRSTTKPRKQSRRRGKYCLFLAQAYQISDCVTTLDTIDEVSGFIEEWIRREAKRPTGLVVAVKATKGGDL